MQGGVVIERAEGTPQGGPLSPLLANLLLDEWDRELDRRGHRFCRYADDCNIYVRSRKAGQRVMAWCRKLLEGRLRLKVNEEKSAVDRPWNRKFLGLSVTNGRVPKLRSGRPVGGADAIVHPGDYRPKAWHLRPPDGGRTEPIPAGMARVLPAGRDAQSLRGTGWLDSPPPPLLLVIAVEGGPRPSPGSSSFGRPRGGEYLLESQRSLASVENPADAGGADRALLPLAGPPEPYRSVACLDAGKLNRRVRPRMPGGVGGSGREAAPYADWQGLPATFA